MSKTSAVPDETDFRVAARLRARRQELDLDPRLLDTVIGEAPGTVERFEAAIRRVGAAHLYRLSRALDVDVAYFFDADETPPPPPAEEDEPDARRAGEARRFAEAVSGIAQPSVRFTVRALVESLSRTGSDVITPWPDDDDETS